MTVAQRDDVDDSSETSELGDAVTQSKSPSWATGVNPARRTGRRAQRGSLIPGRSADDSDIGWGGADTPDVRDDAWYQEQRPPHWE